MRLRVIYISQPLNFRHDDQSQCFHRLCEHFLILNTRTLRCLQAFTTFAIGIHVNNIYDKFQLHVYTDCVFEPAVAILCKINIKKLKG